MPTFMPEGQQKVSILTLTPGMILRLLLLFYVCTKVK